ncbi:hybrid sensor histidine kinase/response regulator [Phenylobacterium hankyongense]|uniref:Sensory/regulatory protein RpfC n=2 Tax=Phenylobacterium hankyongense TaxID=1813876 RepID=A0A328B7K3_9CAUL|nr:hybrid sensor histidine kinase/response regulator [Phenylobacterium hankyongense]
MDTHRRSRWLRPLTYAATANSLAAGALQALMVVVIWRGGGDLAHGFAVVTAFIGLSYVLLHYYANLVMFRLLSAPYAAALAYIGYDLVRAGGLKTAALVVVAAAVVSVANFFHLSRRQLDRSRSALRLARLRAEAGELAAESASRAKSTFLATMSHEIRTPLNGVLGMAQAMAADDLTDKQRDRLGVIHESGEALLAILNDILDLSKVEAGKLDLESIEFDLAEVARGAHSAFTALANKKGLSFAVNVEAARGRYLGDPTRLRQILYNLISNALKFTDEGEIRVTALRDGDMLEISVADTGVGISPEGLARLFGKFDQLDSSTTRRFGGTGLGLAICRELAQLMGGEMSVESELGRGSRFILRAPIAHIGDERPTGAGAPPAPEARQSLSLRVLAAEDNSVNQLVLRTLLHQLGVEPVVVDNGAAAVQAWAGAHWDVVLMDVQMPDMDGIEATARIRALEREMGRPRTPIVALTANAMSHQIERYLAAGMDTHVSKPIEACALFEALTLAAALGEATAAPAKVA